MKILHITGALEILIRYLYWAGAKCLYYFTEYGEGLLNAKCGEWKPG